MNRFGRPYRGRGFKDFVKKILKTGAKTSIEKGGEVVGTALKNSSNPAFQVLGHIATNTSKGMAEAIQGDGPRKVEPVKAINIKADVEDAARTSGQQQAEQIRSKNVNKRKADTADLAPKKKSSRRAKGGGSVARRRKKDAALWDIWNC